MKSDYYVYVVQSCRDKGLYYGRTRDLKNRIREHNSGRTKSLRGRIPVALIYYEKVNGMDKAVQREKYFKTGFGRKYIKNKIIELRGGSSAG